MKKIYLDEIEDKSRELINFSKNDVALEIEELKKIPNNFIWEGLVKDKYLIGYNNRINKLSELNNNVSKIAEFLLRVNEDYHGANQRIDNAYEELLNEIKAWGDE